MTLRSKKHQRLNGSRFDNGLTTVSDPEASALKLPDIIGGTEGPPPIENIKYSNGNMTYSVKGIYYIIYNVSDGFYRTIKGLSRKRKNRKHVLDKLKGKNPQRTNNYYTRDDTDPQKITGEIPDPINTNLNWEITENTEIILNNKKYLLEKGDIIIIF